MSLDCGKLDQLEETHTETGDANSSTKKASTGQKLEPRTFC